jgi:hypothetical protein
MDLLGDIGHLESRFNPFEDAVLFVQDRCTVCAKDTIGTKSFWTHPMVLLGEVA